MYFWKTFYKVASEYKSEDMIIKITFQAGERRTRSVKEDVIGMFEGGGEL